MAPPPPEIGTAATGASTLPNPPTLTPSWGAADTLWLVVAGASGAVTASAYPTNYTDGNDDATSSGTAASIASARRALNAATEDPGTFTISASTNWVAQTLAVRPAAGAAVPAAPTNLVATAVSTTQINLTWDDNATDETSFRVERSPDGIGSWVTVGTPAADAESFSNTGLTCETEYFYRVFAVNGTGDSLPSNTDSATTSACPPPPVGGGYGAIRKPPRNVTR